MPDGRDRRVRRVAAIGAALSLCLLLTACPGGGGGSGSADGGGGKLGKTAKADTTKWTDVFRHASATPQGSHMPKLGLLPRGGGPSSGSLGLHWGRRLR